MLVLRGTIKTKRCYVHVHRGPADIQSQYLRKMRHLGTANKKYDFFLFISILLFHELYSRRISLYLQKL